MTLTEIKSALKSGVGKTVLVTPRLLHGRFQALETVIQNWYKGLTVTPPGIGAVPVLVPAVKK